MDTIKNHRDEKNKIFDEFVKDTTGENILQIVLRSHLYLENALEKIAREILVKPDLVLNERSMFKNKLLLVSALGVLPHEVHVLLTKFNGIRNKFAHNLKFELQEGDLKKLVDIFDPQTKVAYKHFKENIREHEDRLKSIDHLIVELRIIAASLLISVNTYHTLYLMESLEKNIDIFNEFKEILLKTKDEQKVYIEGKRKELLVHLEGLTSLE